jgi:hypothetical protein
MQTHANFDLGPCALRAWQLVCISICWLVILLEFVHILKYSYIAIFILCAFCIECTLTSGSSSAQTQQLATQSSSVPAKVYSSWIFGNGPKVHIRVGCDSCGVMLFIFSSLCLSCLIIAKVAHNLFMNKFQSQMHNFPLEGLALLLNACSELGWHFLTCYCIYPQKISYLPSLCLFLCLFSSIAQQKWTPFSKISS